MQNRKFRNSNILSALRFMMRPQGLGVFDRDWKVDFLHASIEFDRESCRQKFGTDELFVFPEFGDREGFVVDGVRLVERLSLVWVIEEMQIQRLKLDDPSKSDLLLYEDSGNILVVEYEKLDSQIEAL